MVGANTLLGGQRLQLLRSLVGWEEIRVGGFHNPGFGAKKCFGARGAGIFRREWVGVESPRIGTGGLPSCRGLSALCELWGCRWWQDRGLGGGLGVLGVSTSTGAARGRRGVEVPGRGGVLLVGRGTFCCRSSSLERCAIACEAGPVVQRRATAWRARGKVGGHTQASAGIEVGGGNQSAAGLPRRGAVGLGMSYGEGPRSDVIYFLSRVACPGWWGVVLSSGLARSGGRWGGRGGWLLGGRFTVWWGGLG